MLRLAPLPAGMRYRRSPSAFSDSSVSLSFLRTTPAKNPRTECCCDPVAFMIAAMVAPLGWLSRASTAACLELARVVGTRPGFLAAAFFAALLLGGALTSLVLLGMLGSFHRLRRQLAPSPPQPRNG